MWGIFPLKNEISWEGHLFGALAGVLVAFNYRKEGPQRKVYEWETEQDSDDDEITEQSEQNDMEAPPETENKNDIRINYLYKPNPFNKQN